MSVFEAMQWGFMAVAIAMYLYTLVLFHAAFAAGKQLPFPAIVAVACCVGVTVFLVRLPG